MKKTVEIRAPHNGAVQDVNIYGLDSKIVELIISDIKAGASFAHKAKAEIDDFELADDNGLFLKLSVCGVTKSYALGSFPVEVTFGGLAYNIFHDLYALNHSFNDRLALVPFIGLPDDMIKELKTKGIEPYYFLPAKVRKSLMIVSEDVQLNIVTRKSEVYGGLPASPVPDIAVISSYPSDRNADELARIRQYGSARQDFRAYLNPGGNQVRIGMPGFKAVAHLIKAAVMKLDEAAVFLGIEDKFHSREGFALECLAGFRREGINIVVLNDSERGSYMGYNRIAYHTNPFPKQPLEGILKKSLRITENFSGCGDGVFSAVLYSLEADDSMSPQELLVHASSLARLISLLPASNLYGISPDIIRQARAISNGYTAMAERIA